MRKTSFNHKDGVTLKELVLSKMDDCQARTEVKFKAMDKALNIATNIMERRLEGMNEFREQLNRQANTFVTRDVLQITLDKLDSQIRSLELSRADLAGKASQSTVNLSLLMGFIGIAIGVISLLLKIL